MRLAFVILLLLQDTGLGVVDIPIHAGRLFQAESGFEFRPCDSDDILAVDATMQIISELDTLFQSQTDATHEPIYVRFHGKRVTLPEGQSNQFSGGIRILEVLFGSARIPIDCK